MKFAKDSKKSKKVVEEVTEEEVVETEELAEIEEEPLLPLMINFPPSSRDSQRIRGV